MNEKLDNLTLKTKVNMQIIETNFARKEIIDTLKTMMEIADNTIFKTGLEIQFKEYIAQDKRYILETIIQRIRNDIETIQAELSNQMIEVTKCKK